LIAAYDHSAIDLILPVKKPPTSSQKLNNNKAIDFL
jgi:hypothetical protein